MPRYNTGGGASARPYRPNGLKQVAYFDGGGVFNASNAARPAGIQVGDLVIVFQVIGNAALQTSGGGSLWSFVTIASGHRVYYKTLNATDVANSWNFAAGSQYSFTWVWRPGLSGATAISIDGANSVSSSGLTTCTIPGVAAGNAHGVASVLWDTGTFPSGTVPANWTRRYQNSVSGGTQVAADQLTNKYFGGPIIWTGVTTSPVRGFAFKFV